MVSLALFGLRYKLIDRYLIDAKIEEMKYYIGKNPTPKEMRMYFKERFNINVDK